MHFIDNHCICSVPKKYRWCCSSSSTHLKRKIYRSSTLSLSHLLTTSTRCWHLWAHSKLIESVCLSVSFDNAFSGCLREMQKRNCDFWEGELSVVRRILERSLLSFKLNRWRFLTQFGRGRQVVVLERKRWWKNVGLILIKLE